MVALFPLPLEVQAQASQCPLLNGAYVREAKIGTKIHRYKIALLTRIEHGVVLYTVDIRGRAMPADGQVRPISVGDRKGAIKQSCEDGALVREMREDGAKTWNRLKVKPLSSTQWDEESNLEGWSGIYTKVSD